MDDKGNNVIRKLIYAFPFLIFLITFSIYLLNIGFPLDVIGESDIKVFRRDEGLYASYRGGITDIIYGDLSRLFNKSLPNDQYRYFVKINVSIIEVDIEYSLINYVVKITDESGDTITIDKTYKNIDGTPFISINNTKYLSPHFRGLSDYYIDSFSLEIRTNNSYLSGKVSISEARGSTYRVYFNYTFLANITTGLGEVINMTVHDILSYNVDINSGVVISASHVLIPPLIDEGIYATASYNLVDTNAKLTPKWNRITQTLLMISDIVDWISGGNILIGIVIAYLIIMSFLLGVFLGFKYLFK